MSGVDSYASYVPLFGQNTVILRCDPAYPKRQ